MAPAAPSRPTRPTRSRIAATASQGSDQLIETFDSLSISNEPPPLTASVKPTIKARTIPITRAPIASTSNLSKTKTTTGRVPIKSVPSIKGKEKEIDSISDADAASEAMKVININLKSLSTTNKSGWRLSTAVQTKATSGLKTSTINSASTVTKEQIMLVAETCSTALSQLRVLISKGNIRNRLVDAERAAGSLVANLIELELYDSALLQLSSMRTSVMTLYPHNPSHDPPIKSKTIRSVKPTAPTILSYAHLLSIPLPSSKTIFDPPTLEESLDAKIILRPKVEELIPLILVIQQYVVACLFRSQLDAVGMKDRVEVVLSALKKEGNSLDWKLLAEEHPREFEGSVEKEAISKKVDTIMTSMFGAITKGLIGADSFSDCETLLSARIYPILFYSTTRPLYADPLKLDAFYDQIRKVFLLFGRNAEPAKRSAVQINVCIKPCFERILNILDSKKISNQGTVWIALCEVVLSVAKRAGDLSMVEKVSILIGGDAPGDAVAQSGQICARLASATAVLEVYRKTRTDNGVREQILKISESLSTITRVRSQELGLDCVTKLDKAAERLRYSAVRVLEGDKRTDELMTKAGAIRVDNTEIELCLLSLLNSFALHVESLRGNFSKSLPTRELQGEASLFSGAADSLLLLSYSTLVIDDRLSYAPSFKFLERSLPFIGVKTSSDKMVLETVPETLDSIRPLASALYKIGGTLYNISKPESAIKFLELSCKIGAATLEICKDIKTDGTDSGQRGVALLELTRYMTKRWELLALASHSIGEKKLAYGAYVCAIQSYPIDSLSLLATSAATSPLSILITRDPALLKLIQRSTRLATFDLLLPPLSISLRKGMETAGHSTEIVAMVLELQLLSLEPSLQKPEAQAMIPTILTELLSIYSPLEYPIRRARTLVRQMRHHCTSSEIDSDFSCAGVVTEVDQLCTVEDFGLDLKLRPFSSQYLAFSHLWLGFQNHRSKQEGVESISSEARQALQILRQSFDGIMPSSPSVAKIGSPILAKVALNPTNTRAPTTRENPKTPQVVRTTTRKPFALLTPPTRNGVDLTDKITTPTQLTTLGLPLDEPEKSYEFLETMANLLGALGYSLLRISYLKFLRRLSIKGRANAHDSFVITSAHLGHEYLLLGKLSRAGLVFAQAESRLQSSSISTSCKVNYLLFYSEYLASIGNHDRSATIYSEALEVNCTLPEEDPAQPTSARMVERTIRLQRSALASSVASTILQKRGDLTRSLLPAMQALRVWSRALANISRLSTKEQTSSDIEPPAVFDGPPIDRENPIVELVARKKNSVGLTAQNSGLVWSLAESLACALLRVAQLYSIRGTPKSAEHFATQALDFAHDLGSSRLAARALVVRAELRMHAGNDNGSLEDLDLVTSLLESTSAPEAASEIKLRADLAMRSDSLAEAHQFYLEAQKTLDNFVEAAGEGEIIPPSPMKPAVSTSTLIKSAISPSPGRPGVATDRILPSLHAYLLRMRVCLLRIEDKSDESQLLLRQLSRIGASDEDRADEFKLLASIQLQDLLRQFGSDPVLGMLQESVLSLPALGIPSLKSTTPARSGSLAASLREVESLLARAMSLSVSRVAPSKLRDLSLHTAELRALQSSIRPSKSAASGVASVLDLGLAVTLRREMLDAIEHKLEDRVSHNDLTWPLLDEITLDEVMDPNLRYWTSIRERYRHESAELNLTDQGLSSQLPINWTTVSIHLTAEADSLVLVKHSAGVNPLVFKLPLDRFSRREGEDETFSHSIALAELKEIISSSNLTAQNAKFAKEKDQRAAWWKERKELDARLKLLTETIEDSWLGAFKSVFLNSKKFSLTALATFKDVIEKIVKRIITKPTNSRSSRLKLDDSILYCLSALPHACREEDLEDLFYFIMESFQFTGVPVAYDEIDVDQVVCDIRAALETLQMSKMIEKETSQDQHIFLILDKSVQSFPWESIPCLLGQSVSRIPSISFLRDRIDLASSLSTSSEILVNSKETSFVLNAEGDLTNTQERFSPWLKRMKSVGWDGVIGRSPMEEEMKSALVNKELFLYFGHGGAEQYIRSQTIRNLPRCAVTMLWGCSSGHLKDLGDFDPIGTPYHYMLAGCPALVANLWDVTDKDIDKFSETVFQKLGLDTIRDETVDLSPESTLASAISSSRNVCNLRYLNGAAPVLYGIPVKFTRLDGGAE